MQYACLKIDWVVANKVNNDYRVFIDPVITNTPSCTDSYVLAIDQVDFDRLSVQTGFVPSSVVSSSTSLPFGLSKDLSNLDPTLLSFGFLFSFIFYAIGLAFGLAIGIFKRAGRMR